MPIIKSAKKRVIQSKKAYERNKHYSTRMRTMVKKVLKETDAVKAEKLVPEIYSAIDVALKKNLLHRNTAARKKARVTRFVKNLKEGKTVVEVKKKTATASKKPVTKKTTTAKKTVKKVAEKK